MNVTRYSLHARKGEHKIRNWSTSLPSFLPLPANAALNGVFHWLLPCTVAHAHNHIFWFFLRASATPFSRSFNDYRPVELRGLMTKAIIIIIQCVLHNRSLLLPAARCCRNVYAQLDCKQRCQNAENNWVQRRFENLNFTIHWLVAAYNNIAAKVTKLIMRSS